MRELIAHKIDGSEQPSIIVVDERGAGNANHVYKIVNTEDKQNVKDIVEISFQNGPVKENGINGITNEILLALVIDRLEGFQSGPFACAENELALSFATRALQSLKSRTALRKARGVEGTNVK